MAGANDPARKETATHSCRPPPTPNVLLREFISHRALYCDLRWREIWIRIWAKLIWAGRAGSHVAAFFCACLLFARKIRFLSHPMRPVREVATSRVKFQVVARKWLLRAGNAHSARGKWGVRGNSHFAQKRAFFVVRFLPDPARFGEIRYVWLRGVRALSAHLVRNAKSQKRANFAQFSGRKKIAGGTAAGHRRDLLWKCDGFLKSVPIFSPKFRWVL